MDGIRLLDLFPGYLVEDEKNVKLSDAMVLEANIDRSRSRIVIEADFAEYLSAGELRRLESDLLKENKSLTLRIRPHFPISQLPRMMGEDLTDVVCEVCPQGRAILAGCKWTVKDDRVRLSLRQNGRDMIRQHLTAAEHYIKECFGCEMRVELEEKDELCPDELFRETAQMRKVAMEVRPLPTTAKKEKKEAPSEMIYGRAFRENVTPIKDLDINMSRVCVEGKVVALAHRELTKRNAWVINFDMTDYTDSVRINSFMEAEKAGPLIEKIKEGMWIRVLGKMNFNKYENENILQPNAIMEIEHAQRQDRSEEKRIELHLHTKMSAMDALTDTDAVVKTAARWGHRAIAITDHGVVQSFPDAMKAGKKYSVKIVYGCEGYFVDDLSAHKNWHIILLAKNQIGLKNLYRLVSLGHLEYYKKVPRIPRFELEKWREGLIIGSACESGELFSAIVAGKPEEELLRIASFYDYLEIQPICNNAFLVRNGTAKDNDQLREYNKEVARLAKLLDKPLVATGDVHFLEPEDEVYRHILLASRGFSDADKQLPLYFKTTDEMLEEFSYLGEETAYQAVITNPGRIVDQCDELRPVPVGLFAPKIENSAQTLKSLVYGRLRELYGEEENLPDLIRRRVETELGDIINCEYDVIYMIAQKLVAKSNEDGYLVGSRGSVGSSIVAYLSGITEVNSFPPHYRCPNCRYTTFDVPEEAACGADLPDANCPKCGTKMAKDGFNIPFQTFLGFGGDKVPDIDLNFSGEYQARAHAYTVEMFGKDHVFRAGTIGTVASKTAYGYVKKYLQERGLTSSRAEENRLTEGCVGVKRTTGQHPGGLVVVPADKEIYDFCPVQHPADDVNAEWITTHFEYHAMEENLLKLDMLGHDDPTMVKMLEDLTGIRVKELPLDDPDTMSIFTSSKVLGYENDEILGPTGATAIPEFGTSFTRGMLVETQPTKFDTLLRISGFSHGTDVWLGNARDIILSGTATAQEVIGCRDDIMLYLIRCGLPDKRSFKIMEAVRKGRGLPDGAEEEMRAANIPEWYIDSCKKIKYLFPKAHAVAYVMMAFRIAWFKVHRPLAFYAAYFSIRAVAFDAAVMTGGMEAVLNKMKEINEKEDATQNEKDMVVTLEVCYEFYLRGFRFEQMDLYRSDATKFIIDGSALIPPFVAVAGLGETAAANIVENRAGRTFVAIDEFSGACPKVTKAHIESLKAVGVFGDLPETSQISLF